MRARTVWIGAALLPFVAAAAFASPPKSGVVVPGKSLGGLGLGMTPARVESRWGGDHGVCRSCPTLTWYYNYRRFEPRGAAVVFRRGRVVALYTLWAPLGWHTTRGLTVGDAEGRITEIYGPLTRSDCRGYYVLTQPRGPTVTSFYVVDGKLWGFGLSRAGAPACR